MAQTKATTRDEFLILLHLATVELLVVKELKKPLSAVFDITESDEVLTLLNQVTIKPSSDSASGALTFPNDEAKTRIFNAFENTEIQQDNASKENHQVSNETEEAIVDESPDAADAVEADDSAHVQESQFHVPSDLDFLKIAFQDPEFKFQVRKYSHPHSLEVNAVANTYYLGF